MLDRALGYFLAPIDKMLAELDRDLSTMFWDEHRRDERVGRG
jgi:hypothetical protein